MEIVWIYLTQMNTEVFIFKYLTNRNYTRARHKAYFVTDFLKIQYFHNMHLQRTFWRFHMYGRCKIWWFYMHTSCSECMMKLRNISIITHAVPILSCNWMFLPFDQYFQIPPALSHLETTLVHSISKFTLKNNYIKVRS